MPMKSPKEVPAIRKNLLQCWDGSLLLVCDNGVSGVLNGGVDVSNKPPKPCLTVLILVVKNDCNGNEECVAIGSIFVATVESVLAKVHMCCVGLKDRLE